MNIGHLTLLTVLAINLLLGLLVLSTNRKKISNQVFFLLSLTIAAWLLFLEAGFSSSDPAFIELCVRCSSMVGALLPAAFNFLRLAIKDKDLKFKQILVESSGWITAGFIASILVQTRFFLQEVQLDPEMANQYTPGQPVYGPGFAIYNIYYLVALIILVVRFVQDTRRAEGIQRAEFQFVLIGSATCLFVGVLLAMIIPLVTGSSATVQFAPICVVFLDGFIAYGIATRHIMDVATVLRRTTAYALLTAYLLVVYLVVWWVSGFILRQIADIPTMVPHILGTLAVAFSLAPANGIMQLFAKRLFINYAAIDVGATVREANRILRSITTTHELIERFSDVVSDAVGTDEVHVLLEDNNEFCEVVSASPVQVPIRIAHDNPIIQIIAAEELPLVTDLVGRRPPTAQLTRAAEQLRSLQISIVLAIRSKEKKIAGLLLLGPRLSGRIYGTVEQEALQMLSNQLAVALENAKLYTQIQDSKIYNDILVDNLVSGVIAVNANRLVTVFNREAQRVTRVPSHEMIDHHMDKLPVALSHALEQTLLTGNGFRDREIVLRLPEDDLQIPIRLGSSIFRGHQGDVLGALIVFSDLSIFKKLEEQVRRTDRLASLGTLSAGMAHEIKNPLVSIKTFTELLPERYEDTDFRETFFSLVGHEVRRIDALVNQLLKFARPTKPDLRPTCLHDVLNNSNRLVSQQLNHKGIHLERQYQADNDTIQGDPDLLEQAIINFLLNAIDAMDDDGVLTVRTEVTGGEEPWHQKSERPHIKLMISDTGKGIKQDDLARVFDPFFTTKVDGTGLGLSVSHGIIAEHGGIIDVESEINKGTTINLIFPLIQKGATV